ncbi:MAG: OmpA family protein [Paludibacter sp.]|nr:OmpA family protein [Paludibacter sp.]
MKRLFYLLFLTFSIVYASAQEVIKMPAHLVYNTLSAEEEDSLNQNFCTYVPLSHWSIGIKAGGNYFRVIPGPLSNSATVHLIYGGTLEYSINPLVGLGLEYNYNPYGHQYHINSTQIGTLDGYTHDAIIYSSVNLSNLYASYRSGFWNKLDIYGDLGVGVGFYHFKLSDANNKTIPDSNHVVPITLMAKIGLNMEYNLTKSFALGAEVQYRYYDRGNLGGISWAKGYCDAFTATVGFRYKLNANGFKKHARNMPIGEYYTKLFQGKDKTTDENTIETLKHIKTIEADNEAIKKQIKKIIKENAIISPMNLGLDSDSIQNIEFEFDSDVISTDSYSLLDKIASILLENKTSIKLAVSAYNDFIGTEEYNKTLSVRRANAVRNYLLDKNVPASSIIISGNGNTKPIDTNDTEDGRKKNRLVEFRFIPVN